MKAQDARQNAYSFHKDEIARIKMMINAASLQGEMSMDLDGLPHAIEDYLINDGYSIMRLHPDLIIISWGS